MSTAQAAPLAERYRPTTWRQVVGQAGVLARLDLLRQRSGLAGKAFWLTGPSGTGKSSIARLLAAEVAGEWGVEELDATGLMPSRIQELERQTFTRGLYGPGHALIVNESHGLRVDAVRQLLTTLERIPPDCVWIFTTTSEGQGRLLEGIDAAPLLSRCIVLEMATEGLDRAFAAKAKRIAEREGLDGGQPLSAYVALARDCSANLRQMLSRIESGELLLP